MEKEIKELQVLGADVVEVEGGLKLIGSWREKYNPYHKLFIEITGNLDTSNVAQNKDFLSGLKSLGYLYTYNEVQDKNFLSGLRSLRSLHTLFAVHHKDFLSGLQSLGSLNTSHAVQHKDFLSGLKSLGNLYTYYAVQHKDFLSGLQSLGNLYTYYAVQDKNFLSGLQLLGSLNTSYAVQDKSFLSDLRSLGYLDTSYAVQDKDFLKNSTNVFELPLVCLDGILSEVKSERDIDGIKLLVTNRVGYLDVEYIATDGETHAHASSIRMALIDFRFKKSDRDKSWLEGKSLDSVLSFDDSVLAYRTITGACSGGVEGFLKEHSEKSEYSISEIIELTKGQYRSRQFKEFFSK